MQRQAVRFTRILGSRRGFLLAAIIATALTAIGLWAFRALLPPPPPMPVLTGTYMADDGGIYYVQQSGNTLWWAGMSLDTELPADLQWHRGLTFTNLFRGTITSDNTVAGEWIDVTRGATLNGGTLTIRFGTSNGVTQFNRIVATGNFGATTWHQIDPLDDTKFSGATMDIISRFDHVRKNDGQALHHNNLKPYRDQTVVYGRLINSHLDYLDHNKVESEIPHINCGPRFDPEIPNFRNFSFQGREFEDFACFHASEGDADFDLRLKVDLNKLEPDFYTTGWGDRTSGPKVFALKLNAAITREKLGFAANEAYMGLEAIMYGRPGTCDGHPSPVNGGLSMLPGWADLFSNSVLINGRPMDGSFIPPHATETCSFVQPCPFVNGVTPDNFLEVPAGIQLGHLLLSANGNGQIDAQGNAESGPGTYLRVTGTLVLDCGHFVGLFDHTCFDDDPEGDPDDISGHSNQEIHPVYSIDVINSPYRPEDINIQGQTDLTGTYGGSDGSTYYVRQTGSTNVRQPGRTIWWLGLMRDRQSVQRGTDFPIIGSKQLKPAFDANDPPCPSGECWAFANVFKGTITESPVQIVIEGDWAGVPQSASAGSSGGHMKFFVFNHKIIIPATPSIFPVTIEKMYDPLGFGGAQGTQTLGTR
jgi:hypothetical protein